MKKDRDLIYYGMGYVSGIAAGVLLSAGITVYTAYKFSNKMKGAVAKAMAEADPKLASVTPLHREEPFLTEEQIQKNLRETREKEGNDGTQTTPDSSPPGG